MAGCYGGSKEDRYFESQLNKHLADQEVPGPCEDCSLEDKEWEDCEKNPDCCSTGDLQEVEPDYDQMREDREYADDMRAERYNP